MWSDRVSNPGPLAHESDALPTALLNTSGPLFFKDPAELLLRPIRLYCENQIINTNRSEVVG